MTLAPSFFTPSPKLCKMPAALPHRRFIVFSGNRHWCAAQAEALLKPIAAENKVWLGEGHLTHKQALPLLGEEFVAVTYDAFSGLDLQAFAAVCGSIVAGGALILLCPDFKLWPSFADPINARWTPYPLRPEDITGLTLARWAQILSRAAVVEHYTAAADAVPKRLTPAHRPATAAAIAITPSADQATAMAALMRVVTGQRKRPAVITADRGRGKSAALGMAIAQLAVRGLVQKVAVVGGQQQSLLTLFKHLRAALCPQINADTTVANPAANPVELVSHNGVLIQRVNLDTLLDCATDYDLIVIDEAATLGLPRLISLLQNHSRLAFATTVQGYEGSGRGFHLKFKAHLDKHSRGARFVHLTTPMRWAADDPVEALCADLLLLNTTIDNAPAVAAIPVIDNPAVTAATDNNTPAVTTDNNAVTTDNNAVTAIDNNAPAAISHALLSPQSLLDNPATLAQVMALLMTAHYQTSPNDVRYLLDGPKHQLFVQQHRRQIIGVAWIGFEGGFDTAMAQAMCFGKRRPKGHLIASALAAHMGLATAAQSHIARVQRLAIHPQLRRQGLGKTLLRYVENALSGRVDLMASSFAISAEILPFWQQAAYSLVRLSDQQNAASGAHSAMMIKAMNPVGAAVLAQAQSAFAAQFPAQLPTSLSQLEWPLLAQLLLATAAFKPKTPPPLNSNLSADTLRDLTYFAHGTRPLESSLGALTALAMAALAQPNERSKLLICKVLQNQSWTQIAAQFAMRGRQEIETALRQAVQFLLE